MSFKLNLSEGLKSYSEDLQVALNQLEELLSNSQNLNVLTNDHNKKIQKAIGDCDNNVNQ